MTLQAPCTHLGINLGGGNTQVQSGSLIRSDGSAGASGMAELLGA